MFRARTGGGAARRTPDIYLPLLSSSPQSPCSAALTAATASATTAIRPTTIRMTVRVRERAGSSSSQRKRNVERPGGDSRNTTNKAMGNRRMVKIFSPLTKAILARLTNLC